eukprot:9215701-Pyramimonas_sp.AAC.1
MVIRLTEKVARRGLLQPPQKCFRGRDMLVNVMEAESFLLEHRLRDRYSSDIVLAGFESAFPSIDISWVLRVLSAMGVPIVFVKVFQALYRHISA